MGESSPLEVKKEGSISWLILNRPEKRNAMAMEFFDQLGRHFAAFDEDPDVRAVIIRAEGESFTAGIDLVALAPLLQGDGASFRETLKKKILRLQEAFHAVERCRKPVIAAVHSHCIGGGVDLLSACDIRLASRDAVFAVRETKVAMIADLGTLQRLPHIIGQGHFRELVLTGRNFSAEEALRMGFITRLCDDRESLYTEARMVAEEIAGCSPLAVQGAKEVMNYSRDHGVWAGFEYVAQKNAAVLLSEDLMEAFKAFMEKRQARFKGN